MAKRPLVKCKYCGKSLDRDTEEYVQIKNRYAHKYCADHPVETLVQDDRARIMDFIQNKFGVEADYSKTQRLLNKYISEGMTASGVLKTLQYYYDITGHSTVDSMGSIGIVPYVYKEAKEYYQKSWDANRFNEQAEFKMDTVSLTIENPQTKTPKKQSFFDFLDREANGEQI